MGLNSRPRIGVTTATWGADPARDGVRRTYTRAIIVSQGVPLLIPNLPGAEAALYGCQGLLLTGGGDIDPRRFGWEDQGTEWDSVDADRDAMETAAIGLAMERGLPILAICRGMQVLAAVAGGTLWQDLGKSAIPSIGQHRQNAPRTSPTHEVTLHPASALGRRWDHTVIRVNSFHHQAVNQLPPGWTLAGCSADGVVEAMEGPGEVWRVGVQWHPEDLFDGDAFARQLFRDFVAAAQKYGEHR